MIIAILSSLAAAALLAVATVLQQSSARAAPPSESLRFRLLLDLIRTPRWLAGIGVSAVAFGFQGIALAFGPLTLVEPLLVTELAFALPLAARSGDGSVGWREWAGTALVMVGLTIFLIGASPGGPGAGHRNASISTWSKTMAAVAAVIAAGTLLAGRRRGARRATFLGFCAGVLFAVLAALLKATTETLAHHGFLAVWKTWQLYALAVVSPAGELFAQSAFQAGPLAASLPMIDATDPILGVVIGLTVFREPVHHSPAALVLVITGAAAIISGIVLIDTSPLMLTLQRDAGNSPDASSSRAASSDSTAPGSPASDS